MRVSGAIKLEKEPAKVAIARSVNILVGFLMTGTNLEEPFPANEIVGGLLIIATIILSTQEKRLIEMRPCLGKSLPACSKDCCSCSAATSQNPVSQVCCEEQAQLKVETDTIDVKQDQNPV